jgi:hypothetical protein
MVLDSNKNHLKSNLVLGNAMAKSIRQASKKLEALCQHHLAKNSWPHQVERTGNKKDYFTDSNTNR